ncbi:hypothetical protein UFOVP1351_24 [uncultured Caudovirales phage]|uniref:Uncharacterized protein n=1 Tax=uncultured Caudovirales phage TaxID=2100421 RepID=A0A6J5S3W4_9CAUD|nr:hypothetical protein UFOVP1351_24 [uncultured Caudovirales phage]
MSALGIGAVAAPIVGGIIGSEQARSEQERAERIRQQMLELYKNIDVPTVAQQEIQLEKLASQGQLTPELEQALTQGRSEMAGVSTDPRLRDAQMAALAGLQDVANNGGMSATDRARWNQMQSELNQNEQGNRGAIMQDMARRGQAGSGMELAAQLMNQQASAQRASQQGMDVKAQAEQRALQALMQSGDMAGAMRGQEFGEKSAAAQAQDAINRFNVQNRQQVMGGNVDRRNSAQASNLGEKQRIADTNVGLGNQQQMHNKGLIQTQFQNQMSRANGMSGAMGSQANAADDTANRTANMWAGIGSGVGQGAAAYANYNRKKKDEA